MLKIASLIVAFGLLAGQALAGTCTVTSTADDGTAGTLRSCITSASPGDTISFSFSSYPQTIQLTGPQIQIAKSLSIVGPSSDPTQLTIKAYSPAAGSYYDVFDVFQPNTPTGNLVFSLSGLTITTANEAIWTSGYTSVPGYTTTVNLQNVSVLNSSYGAEFDYGATANITQSTISGNYYGLYLLSDSTDPVSVATISQSTIANNDVGIFSTYGNSRIVNSTLFGNGYSTNDGFSAQVVGEPQSNFTFAFSTIDGASTTGTPGIRAVDPTANFTFKSSILANHSAGDCVLDGTPAVSDGYNLDSDGTCVLTGTADQFGTTTAPMATGLAQALASDGGTTQTDALAATGPAIDYIPTSACTDDQGAIVTVDQRSLTRPSGQGCDIGAYEYQNLSTPMNVTLQLSGYPPSAANYNLDATFTTTASFDLGSQPFSLQIGAYTVNVAPGSFKQFQNGTRAGNWAYSNTINGVKLKIQLLNNGGGQYDLQANGGPVNIGTQSPIPIKLVIGNFVGTGSSATSGVSHK